MTLPWYEALDQIRQYVFKVSTPGGSGTGFLISFREKTGLCVVATAYHVIQHAYSWEEPIRLQHAATSHNRLLHADDRVVMTKPVNDSAVVIFAKEDLQINTQPPALAPEGKYLRPGKEIAWAGYPAVAPDEFSFFNGHVSCCLQKDKSYLVDGVAINGVSGGPAFTLVGKELHIIGTVSAYIPNRVMGEALPGVCFVTGIDAFQTIVKDIDTLEEAREKAQETEQQDRGSSPSATTQQEPSP